MYTYIPIQMPMYINAWAFVICMCIYVFPLFCVFLCVCTGRQRLVCPVVTTNPLCPAVISETYPTLHSYQFCPTSDRPYLALDIRREKELERTILSIETNLCLRNIKDKKSRPQVVGSSGLLNSFVHCVSV